MNRKNRSIFVLIASALVVGAFLYWNSSKSVTPEPQTEPLTLEEAKAIEIDTSTWQTYRSGILDVRYPENMNEVYNLGTYNPKTNWGSMTGPKTFLLGTTNAVQIAGIYLPSTLHQRLLTENDKHDYGSRIEMFAYTFSESVPLDKIMDSELREMAPNRPIEVLVDGKTYTSVTRQEGLNTVRDYIRVTDQGTTLYVRFVTPGPSAARPPVLEMAQRIVEKMLTSIMVP